MDALFIPANLQHGIQSLPFKMLSIYVLIMTNLFQDKKEYRKPFFMRFPIQSLYIKIDILQYFNNLLMDFV
ncbi:hypothetical protein CQ022_10160 [Chryseobacterium culicis]|uniref:Uncharacterized protein n=1 Tax=Chryseobacterium culicis TaxID=680127 RepID=A0A2S9D1M3_CHRCI|nr:hypothetical protein CQ022_10160 [Chryseobacterium culicis]PRB92344.1 hypothetical protein CQ033_03830 [Chryseobacterium culicis]